LIKIPADNSRNFCYTKKDVEQEQTKRFLYETAESQVREVLL